MSRLKSVCFDANIVAHVLAISAMLFISLIVLGVWQPEDTTIAIPTALPAL